VHRCYHGPQRPARERRRDASPVFPRAHRREVVGGERASDACRIAVLRRDRSPYLYHAASPSASIFLHIAISSEGIVAPARRACPPPCPPQASAMRRIRPSRSVHATPGGHRAERRYQSPSAAITT